MKRLLLTAALTLALAPVAAAGMHEGGSKCTGVLEQSGASMAGECLFPFQGWPVGVAGVYDSEPLDPTDAKGKPAEIHMELIARTAGGRSQPLGVECQRVTTGTARCFLEDNDVGDSVTAPEPLPTEIVAILCSSHSHATYSRLAPPEGAFACWSTDAARDDLVADGWFSSHGFDPPPPTPPSEPPIGGLPDLGLDLTQQITTVPYNQYVPTQLVVSKSLGLTYTNVDTARHDVVARDAKRPDGSAPWCASFEDPDDPGALGCPLFWSKLIPGQGTQTPVLGLEDAEPGKSYAFYCSIHPYMTGNMEVVA